MEQFSAFKVRDYFFGSLLIKGVFLDYFNKVECFSVSTYDFSRSKIYLGIKNFFFLFLSVK